jgi:hypothetical protein
MTDDTAPYLAGLEALRDRMIMLAKAGVTMFTCPMCHAAEGELCTSGSTRGNPPRAPHNARRHKALSAMGFNEPTIRQAMASWDADT